MPNMRFDLKSFFLFCLGFLELSQAYAGASKFLIKPIKISQVQQYGDLGGIYCAYDVQFSLPFLSHVSFRGVKTSKEYVTLFNGAHDFWSFQDFVPSDFSLSRRGHEWIYNVRMYARPNEPVPFRPGWDEPSLHCYSIHENNIDDLSIEVTATDQIKTAMVDWDVNEDILLGLSKFSAAYLLEMNLSDPSNWKQFVLPPVYKTGINNYDRPQTIVDSNGEEFLKISRIPNWEIKR